MKGPKGTAALERMLKDMAPVDIEMRAKAIEGVIEKEGPLTAKEIGFKLGKSAGWVGNLLLYGERSGVFYRYRTKQPVKWGLVKNLQKQLELPSEPAAVEMLPVGELCLPADIKRTLDVLQVFHGLNTLEETIAYAVRSHANAVIVKNRVSLASIEEEMDRHQAELERLRKGA